MSEGAFPCLNTADSFLLKITYRSNYPHDRVIFPMGDGTIPPFAPYLITSTLRWMFLLAYIISICPVTSRRFDELMHIDSIYCA